MEIIKSKSFIALMVIIGVLLLVLLFVKISSGNSNDNTNNNNNSNNNSNNQSNIKYPEIGDSAEIILKKVYNSNYDYYTGFDSDSMEKENIFGNKTELSVSKLSQRTRMSLALNTFELDDMDKMNCNTISWNSTWSPKCGSNMGNIAYVLSVQELNNRVEEMFNIRPDYSLLNIDDLTIGICTGENKNSYIFRYIKEQSIFVSTKRSSSCSVNGKLQVDSVEKQQYKGLLTLTINYKKYPASYLNNKYYYGESTNYQDKFFFNVTEDGKYYLDRTTMTKGV